MSSREAFFHFGERGTSSIRLSFRTISSRFARVRLEGGVTERLLSSVNVCWDTRGDGFGDSPCKRTDEALAAEESKGCEVKCNGISGTGG
jgi:hypothetical protein